MKLRNLEERDIEEVMNFIHNCEEMVLERSSIYWIFWKFFHNTCFIAIEDNKIVGILLGFMSQTDSSIGYIYELGVLPKYRKKGIASALIKSFEDKVKENKGNKIYLTTIPKNKNAIIYYKKRGFNNIKEFFKVGKKRIEFWKKL